MLAFIVWIKQLKLSSKYLLKRASTVNRHHKSEIYLQLSPDSPCSRNKNIFISINSICCILRAVIESIAMVHHAISTVTTQDCFQDRHYSLSAMIYNSIKVNLCLWMWTIPRFIILFCVWSTKAEKIRTYFSVHCVCIEVA